MIRVRPFLPLIAILAVAIKNMQQTNISAGFLPEEIM